jgi:hypothetical protein
MRVVQPPEGGFAMFVRSPLWIPVVLCSVFLFPRPAAADTIRITSGFFEVADHFEVRAFNLVGDRRGFRLFGSVGNPGFDAMCTNGPLCAPGEPARVLQFWGGLDFPGASSTHLGVTYEQMNSLNDIAFAGILFDNTVPLPGLTGSTTTLRTPFTMTGDFSVQPRDAAGFAETLRGTGTMTTTWNRTDSPEGGTPGWALAFTRYDFSGDTAVPEPMTLVLVGAGAAVAFARRKRSRRD